MVSKPDLDKFPTASSGDAFGMPLGAGAWPTVSAKGVAPPVRAIDLQQYADYRVPMIDWIKVRRIPYLLQAQTMWGANAHGSNRQVLAPIKALVSRQLRWAHG